MQIYKYFNMYNIVFHNKYSYFHALATNIFYHYMFYLLNFN